MTEWDDDTVPRETVIDRFFGDRAPLAWHYAEVLRTDGVERGMIGPREVPRLWDRHLLNCAAVAPALVTGDTVADVGSGAGLPGVVWAIARPDVTITLVEPLLRRTRFLDEVIERLNLDNVMIRRARAEDVTEQYDVVTARAVANLAKLGRWCLPLVRPRGGRLLALKGSSAAEEVEKARGTLESLGARSIVVATYGDGVLETPTTVVEVLR